MSLNIEDIKWLREQTGAGVMEAKDALGKAQGDREKALRVLEQTGRAHAQKKAGREAHNGQVVSYVHHDGRLGVLLEVNCETDFTGRSDPFKELARGIAMQIAVYNPRYRSEDDIPDEDRVEVMEILNGDVQKAHAGKPESVLSKIGEGQYRKWCEENVLMNQAFFRDPNKTIEQLVNDLILQVKENIVVKRWTRYQIGDQSA
jgi:elongation factor Ts